MMTNIYHISYTPETKEISLFFWGCNFNCLGCLCKKETHNFLLSEHLHLPFEEPTVIADSPEQFISFEDLIKTLDKLEIKKVLLEGQEASLDPLYPQITQALHKRYSSYNTLCSNIYSLPSLKDTDEIAIGLKAVTDSIHKEYTGKSNRQVLANFISLNQAGLKSSVASVFIPGFIDIAETENIAEFIAQVNKDIPYHILPYFKSGFNPWRHPTHEEMEAAEKTARKHLGKVHSWKGDEEMKYEVVKIF
ncbi:radical SAM protein [Dehalococcoides mccartyi CG5]|nr:radical SAM protein [Dehalococcoides mccartyi CG5]